MLQRILLFVVAALLIRAMSCEAAEPQKTDLFVAGEGGYAAYRIPGLVATDRTVLAYCEARKHDAADWGEIDLLVRRSTDGGVTWDAARRPFRAPVDARPNRVAPRRPNGGLTFNNPVAIADGAAVHFLYCVEYSRCFYARSDDGGATFTEPVEITATFEAFRPQYDWKVLATGPGHGIRLDGGRLLVPVWLSTSTNGPHRPSRVATIFSDDGGQTWRAGDLVPTPELANPSETAVAQVGGEVILNIRHEGEPHQRAVVRGRDGATGWGKVEFDPALPEPVCMASLLAVGPPDKPRLLFSNPHNPTGRERKNLTIKLGDDGGHTWPHARTMEPGPSAYSDLAASGEALLCFYERKGTLTLARFTGAWLRGER
jgi:sialidase-1